MNREFVIEYEIFEDIGETVLSVVHIENDEVVNMFKGKNAEKYMRYFLAKRARKYLRLLVREMML